jgi:hypothetical protein
MLCVGRSVAEATAISFDVDGVLVASALNNGSACDEGDDEALIILRDVLELIDAIQRLRSTAVVAVAVNLFPYAFCLGCPGGVVLHVCLGGDIVGALAAFLESSFALVT